ncbi:MAG: nitronate monooxygenase [Pseudomonadota bacterium]
MGQSPGRVTTKGDTMWQDRRICDLLGIDHPILLAPMAGTTTPDMVAAVSNAGGLGSHGCATMAPDTLEAEMAAIRRLTNRPVNLNFFCHEPPRMEEAHHTGLLAALAPHYEAAGIDAPTDMPAPEFVPFGDAHLELLLRHPPSVVSFHFGLPEDAAVAALKDAGATILCSATTVEEARWLEARGVDAIIAQGWEAGGHRGVFLELDNDAQVGLFALLPQVADAVDVPVIAAGGIADGRGIAAAFALGASGVQIGTAFITATETRSHARHQSAVKAGDDRSTRISASVSGRPARTHRTVWMDAMARVDAAPFPLMYHYARPLQAADGDRHQFSLYGQSARLAPQGDAAARLATLVADAQARLG